MTRRSLDTTTGLRPAQIFADGMVLQRHKPIRIWGTGVARSSVAATLGDDTVATLVDDDGSWALTLPERAAARGLTLELDDGQSRLTFRDVAIGEVWIAGGQSNMEFHLEFDADRDETLTGPMNPDIRFFDVPEVSYLAQDAEYDYSRFGFWRSCTREDLPYFSAVGYYFAVELQESLSVPVGIVGCNWGGTPAAAWTDLDKLKNSPGAIWIEEHAAGLHQFDPDQEAELFRSHPMNDRTDPFGDPTLYRMMRDGFTREEEAKFLETVHERVLFTVGTHHPNRPGGLFTTMVQRVASYSARGVFWYQGESDAPHADRYVAVLTAMIDSWRAAWDDPELVFLTTQLAPFGTTLFGGGELFPEVRAQQAAVAAAVPLVWMASSSDVGAEGDIHPKQKKPIGVRLALLARGHVYGHDILCDAPEVHRAHRTDRGIIVHFRYADGLEWDGQPLPIIVRGAEGDELLPVDILVGQHSLELVGDFPAQSRVSFASTGYYYVGLRNASGIPALPFEAVVASSAAGCTSCPAPTAASPRG
jgi:sialate O-acetylesterase